MRLQELLEAKRVGVVYHFTTMEKASFLLSDMQMKPKEGGGISFDGGMFVIDRHRDWVSFTRNHNLKAAPAAGGDGREWAEVRIAFDGDRLSHRHRIEPYHDEDGYLTRHDGQAEERITGTVNVKGAVLKVDFFLDRYMEKKTDWESWCSPPETEEKIAEYTKMAMDDAQWFIRWCGEQAIPCHVVRDFSRK